MARQRLPKVNPSYAAFMPQATAEEDEILFQSIKKEGILQPIIVRTETSDIVDGHRRFGFWQRIVDSGQTNFKLPIDSRSFPEENDVLAFMVEIQLGRRNLSDIQKAFYRGIEYSTSKGPHGDQERFDSNGAGPDCHNDNLAGSTAERLAEKHGVSASTIIRDSQFAAGVQELPDEEKKKVLAGTSDLTKKQLIAAAPVFCRKCRISTPIKDCAACADLRGVKLNGKPPKKPKSGDQKFDWAKYKTKLGTFIRINDQIAVGYACKGSAGHKRALALMGEYVNHMKVWEKELTKGA